MVKSKPSLTASMRTTLFDEFANAHFVDQFGYKQPVIDHPTRKALRAQGLNSGSLFQLYLDENDDYGAAEVMAPKDFDKYVKDNKLRVIYRGDADIEDGDYKLSAVEMQKNFLYDPKYYVGSGMFGDGKYFGNLKTAEEYALDGYFVQGRGSVIKAALKPGAKTITVAALQDEIKRTHPDFALRESMLSVYARSHGYDAILTDSSPDAYVNVINRDALVVSSKIRRVRE